MMTEIKRLFALYLFLSLTLLGVTLPVVYWVRDLHEAEFRVPRELDRIRAEFNLEIDRLNLKVRKANIPYKKVLEYHTNMATLQTTVHMEIDLIEKEWELGRNR